MRGGGFQVVLDPAYRMPQPGERQEAGSAGPAGDPAPAVARTRELLARRAALLGRRDEPPPPVPESALLDAVRRCGGQHRGWLPGGIPDVAPPILQALHINHQAEPAGHPWLVVVSGG
ncbi:hypothetical protein V2W30_24505 [Streptomyces sp. Q6]|uniref:Uncharacterized protein n=1 Tax=Streptomyces citrinus TaxID=3118173 RepID=A0ACD5AGI5_9ACTN